MTDPTLHWAPENSYLVVEVPGWGRTCRLDGDIWHAAAHAGRVVNESRVVDLLDCSPAHARRFSAMALAAVVADAEQGSRNLRRGADSVDLIAPIAEPALAEWEGPPADDRATISAEETGAPAGVRLAMIEDRRDAYRRAERLESENAVLADDVRSLQDRLDLVRELVGRFETDAVRCDAQADAASSEISRAGNRAAAIAHRAAARRLLAVLDGNPVAPRQDLLSRSQHVCFSPSQQVAVGSR